MPYKNDNNITEQTLGKRIDAVLNCIACRMDTPCSDITRRIMLGALTNELEIINPYLESLAYRWSDKLPYGRERPLRVKWEELSKKADMLGQKIEENMKDMPAGSDSSQDSALLLSLQTLSRHIIRVYELLQPFNSPAKYAKYFQEMLQDYELNHWSEKRHEWERSIAVLPAKSMIGYCAEELTKLLDRLKEYGDGCIISKDRTTIYQESVGIKLWQDDTDCQEKANEIICNVRSAIYLAEQCKRPLRQLESEPAEEEPVVELPKPEAAGRSEALQPMSSETLSWIKSRFAVFDKYLINGYTPGWVAMFWDSMAKTSHAAKLDTSNKLYNPLCHILGDLCKEGVYARNTAQMAKEAWDAFECGQNDSKVHRESITRYIRQGLESNAGLRKWIENYISSGERQG